MVKKVVFLCLLIFIGNILEAAPKKTKKYALAICAIMRDDAPYLKEWVDFHLHQGVDHIYLYDNLSEDHPERVLKEYIKKGTVEIIPWKIHHTTRKEWSDCQNGAYMDCAKTKKNQVEWCAFIDTDEFLFCPSGQTLPAFLKGFADYDQVAVNWLIFGTSNIEKAAPGKLIQKLLLRTETKKSNNCKCIVRLQQAVSCHSAHFFETKNMDKFVNPLKQKITPDQFTKNIPNIDKIRIHHYMFRDLDFFYRTKLSRLKHQARDASHMIEYEKSFNQVRDDSILKCLPKANKI